MLRTQREKFIYIAAITDTDGSLVLSRRKEDYGYTYVPYLTVSMASPQIVYFLQEIIGEGFVYQGIKDNKSRWEYRASANCLRKWLPKIAPFLKIKRLEANLLLEILCLNKQTIRKRIWARWNKPKWDSYIQKTQKRLEEIYKEYKQIRANRYPVLA